MADPKFRTEITADPAGYKAGMDQAARIAQQTAQSMGASMAGAMQGMQATMQGAFGKMNAVFAGIQKAVLGVGSVIAGGGAFAAALNTSKDLTVESQKLGRALGISATEGSILAFALSDIYQSAETLLTANRAMTRELRTNEESFLKLGVATRDQNGNFRNSFDIMLDVNKQLVGFKEGIDRNIEGQKIYKKAWEEVSLVVKLTAEVMENSKAKAEALNLVVGAESVAAVTRYRASMNDVGDVMKAISKTVGDAVMPVFTDLGNWFSETGPQRVEFMRQAMAVLVSAFYGVKFAVETAYYGLKTAFESMWEVIKTFVQIAVVAFLKFAETLGFALTGNFSGALATWRRGGEQQAEIWGAATAKIAKIAERNRDAMIKSAEEARAGMVRALEGGFNPRTTTPVKREEGGRSATGGEDKNAFAKWEAELAAARNAYDQMKLEQGSFEQYTLEMERAFWAKKMVLAQGNAALLAQASKKFYDVERQLRKNAFDTEVAEIKGQMAAAETSAQQKIDLANKVYILQVQRHKAGSKEAIEALKDVQKATDDWAKQQREIRDLQADAQKSYQLSRVELERQNLETLEQLGIIKADEKIKRLKDLKQIEYTIELDALQKKVELMGMDPTTDPVKYQEALNKIRELKQKHNLEMAKLDDQLAIETKKSTDKWLDPIADGFQKMIDGMIAGTRKWTDVLRSVLASVAQQFAAVGVKMLVEWVKTEVAKTSATVASVAARTSAEATGSAASTASTAATATTTIGAKAWEAASSVYASIAQIPYVGPFLAPAMAFAAAAMVLGFLGNITKAAGGFDVPSGINPITQLHGGEMVLPKELADRVRGVTGEDGAGGGGPLNFYITTPDTGSFAQYLRSNAAVLAPALRKLARNAAPRG